MTATVNSVTATRTLIDKTVATDAHPAVTQAAELKAANGILEAGTILALNSDGTAEGFDPAAESGSPLLTPIGVLMYSVDTERSTGGIMAVHGILSAKALVTAQGAATASDIAALKAALPVWTA